MPARCPSGLVHDMLLTRPAFVTMASNPSPVETTVAVYAAKGRALYGKFLAELEFRSHSPKSLPYVPRSPGAQPWYRVPSTDPGLARPGQAT